MIGTNIKTLRQEKHVKQETLADAIGVSAQAVSKWETGASDPDIALLPQLATFFGVSIDELFEVPRAEKMERIQNIIGCNRGIDSDISQLLLNQERKCIERSRRIICDTDYELFTVFFIEAVF